jgi:hypothetical protein
MRIPEPGTQASVIPLLQSVVDAGLTTLFAISVAVGMSEGEAARVLGGEIEPTDQQREALESLIGEYAAAVKLVNAATLKRRL